ncbi:MAG: HEAT repeat domain-containing protein [Planctomycetes bacterium]|nr:HEAT repeat domain-containing protein [Planctomycetota bacterium]
MAPDLPEKAIPDAKGHEKAPEKKKPGVKINPTQVGIFFLEVWLPTAISGGLLYFLSGMAPFWTMDRSLALVIFGIVFVLFSLAITVFADNFTTGLRMKDATTSKKRAAIFRMRLVRLSLGGILIPAGILAAAILVNLPFGGTGMDLYIHGATNQTGSTPSGAISEAVLHTSNPATKVQGILTLQALHTPEALSQLFRILTEDRNALRDGGEQLALAGAIASYGTDAKAKLLEFFAKIQPASGIGRAGLTDDLFTRYFSLPLDGLRAEIISQYPDPKARDQKLAQIDALATQMNTSLGQIQAESLPDSQNALMQDFILTTFLKMNLKKDADLLNFANRVAASPEFPENVRGNAILLMGKVGDDKALNVLYSYLKSDSNLIRTRALQAIASLQTKNLAGSQKK